MPELKHPEPIQMVDQILSTQACNRHETPGAFTNGKEMAECQCQQNLCRLICTRSIRAHSGTRPITTPPYGTAYTWPGQWAEAPADPYEERTEWAKVAAHWYGRTKRDTLRRQPPLAADSRRFAGAENQKPAAEGAGFFIFKPSCPNGRPGRIETYEFSIENREFSILNWKLRIENYQFSIEN